MTHSRIREAGLANVSVAVVSWGTVFTPEIFLQDSWTARVHGPFHGTSAGVMPRV